MGGTCTSTAWNKTDGCTTAGVPKFAVYCCNVHCVLGIPALYFCSVGSHPPLGVILPSQSRTWPRPQTFNLLQQPRVLYKGLFCSRRCTALLRGLAEPFASQKALKLLLRCTIKTVFLDFLTYPNKYRKRECNGTGWLLRSRLGGGRFRISTAKQPEKGIKL